MTQERFVETPVTFVSLTTRFAAGVAVLMAAAMLLLTAGCEPSDESRIPFVADPVVTVTSPPTDADIRQSIRRGIEFLIATQSPDGHWGSVGILRNVGMPSYRDSESFQIATTSLCIKALVETAGDDPDALAALARGEQWLIEHAPLFRRQAIRSLFSNWGHIYALDALVAMFVHRPMDDARRDQLRLLIEDQMRQLAVGRSVRGGWGYYNGPPYT
ncbi:MAG: prenyltransferase/squalene oxidase repeat-containing protein, partial [Planctomycetota bacterium]